MIVADCNYALRDANKTVLPGVTQNHVVVIPEISLYSSKMNTSYAAQYLLQTNLYKTWMAGAIGAFLTFFGTEHVLSHIASLSSASENIGGGNGGYRVSAYTNVEGRLADLMDFNMLFPENTTIPSALSSASYLEPARDNDQLALFKLKPEFLLAPTSSTNSTNIEWWFNRVFNSQFFSIRPTLAYPHIRDVNLNTSVPEYGVRPYALIY